jgi:hypothetical protein
VTWEITTDVPELWHNQFLAARLIPGQGLCAVQRFILTTGLLTKLEFAGEIYNYGARYCYPITADAMSDLLDWDGQGDPPGEWVKEKVSERGKHARTR